MATVEDGESLDVAFGGPGKKIGIGQRFRGIRLASRRDGWIGSECW